MPASSGVKKFFESHWEQMVLWTILIGLFYLLKPFFLLIFETFLIVYITKGVVQWVVHRTNLSYRLTAAAVFVLFVSLLGAVGVWVGPQLMAESNQVLLEFAGEGEQQTQEKINRFVEKIVVKSMGEEKAQAVIESGEYAAMMDSAKGEVAKAVKAALPHVLAFILRFVKIGWHILISLFLAIIFSFILVMDWQRIVGKMKDLERSRVRTFYLGAAPHLIAFADVLGKALRAQAIIAVCNTVLTAIGLWFFGVPNIALLSTIVFFCGFIPILGTFLSSIPILLFGVQVGGLLLVFKLVVLIMIVHSFEAYVLNPRITAKVLHVHPILVLILILVGERFFGIWGMVVGVPIGYYVISVLTEQEEGLDAEPSASTQP
ncbi:MAG: AI-2E family transporter [Kiritimatiellaeota bacterium]|nr:AI-2E family transporter [Kiritimatiellota bacterium]